MRAVTDPDDTQAKDALSFASALAGLAFGNAGVHIPHAMSYSVAGMCHDWTAVGYEREAPMVPHGISVVLNAPAAFRMTGWTNPERHRQVAAALGADVSDWTPDQAGKVLANVLIDMMKATGIPNGLAELGYRTDDIPALAKGAHAQQRLLTCAPFEVTLQDLEVLYADAMRYW